MGEIKVDSFIKRSVYAYPFRCLDLVSISSLKPEHVAVWRYSKRPCLHPIIQDGLQLEPRTHKLFIVLVNGVVLDEISMASKIDCGFYNRNRTKYPINLLPYY